MKHKNKTTNVMRHLLCAGLLTGSFLASGGAQAATFSITGTLLGDPRLENPDNLQIDVSISVVDTVATWLVDINSPLHPSAKLDEFYFNLNLDDSLVTDAVVFGGFSPTGWSIKSPADVQGGGSFTPTFMFEALDPPPLGDHIDVTNTVPLSFTATLGRDWVEADFLLAALSTSSDQDLGGGQMGAHLQSLTIAGNCGTVTACSDSGFLLGDYEGGGGGQEVPEPGALGLLGIGLLGMGAARKNRNAVAK